jgi:predicted phosphatase
MIVLENDNVVCFDVDDTLVIWNVPQSMMDQTITFDNFGVDVQLLPHHKHITLMKQFKARGHKVIIWSQGGYQWAREIVKKLDIEQYVDIIICKPKWLVDDVPPSGWTSVSYIPLPGIEAPKGVKLYGLTEDKDEHL